MSNVITLAQYQRDGKTQRHIVRLSEPKDCKVIHIALWKLVKAAKEAEKRKQEQANAKG